MVNGGFIDAPESAVAQALSFQGKIPGLVGLFWGIRGGSGGSTPKLGLSAHVRSRSEESSDKSAFEGGPYGATPRGDIRVEGVEIIDVGAARTCAELNVHGEVQQRSPTLRRSTATAIAYDRNERVTYALLSGHATLPLDDGGEIRREFIAAPGDQSQITIALRDGPSFRGDLLRGHLGRKSQVDWAIAAFQLSERSVDAAHVTHASTPLPLRATPLSLGGEVKFWSRLRGGFSKGFIHEVSISAVRLDLPLGRRPETYSRVASVTPSEGVFCEGGDSGALVFDKEDHVVGIVLGTSDSGDRGYILHVGYLANAIGRKFGLFFKE